MCLRHLVFNIIIFEHQVNEWEKILKHFVKICLR